MARSKLDEGPFVPRRDGLHEQPTDQQAETSEQLQRFEVLVEAPNGHRTVVRVQAKDQAATEKAVAETLAEGSLIVAAGPDGSGLGYG
jgi:hypothetical protein